MSSRNDWRGRARRQGGAPQRSGDGQPEENSGRRLPQEIYQRRRLAAIVGVIIVVALLIWLAVSCTGSKDEDPSPAFSSETNSWQAPAPKTTHRASEDAKDASSSPAPSEPEESKSAQSEPREGTAHKGACELTDLEVTAQVDQPSYASGVQPTFYMTVHNPTGADCTVDLANQPLRFEVYDMATNARVWSDIDCNEPVGKGKSTFGAGKDRHFEAVWSRTTSEPNQCSHRQAVPAGSYYLHAVLGNNPSAAQPFNLAS